MSLEEKITTFARASLNQLLRNYMHFPKQQPPTLHAFAFPGTMRGKFKFSDSFVIPKTYWTNYQ
jgi:hypothetical protein